MEQMETAPRPTQLGAGFWKRALAFVIDCIVLAVVGWILGATMFDALAQLGPYGHLVGFAIALPYFGLMNSRVAGGQTLGKRLLGIRTQGIDGALLSVPRAFARYSVLGVPYFLNGAAIPMRYVMGPGSYVLALLVFGGLFVITYLLIFNRKTRRSLHDYAAASCVVPASAPLAPLPVSPLWRGHVITVAVLLVVALSLPAASKQLMAMPAFAGLWPAYEAVAAAPGVQVAGVNAGVSHFNGASNTYISVLAQLDSPKVEDAALAKDLARRVITAAPGFADRDVMQVTLRYGYDLGIASGWRQYSQRFEPAEFAAPQPLISP